jgi:hypothetical protein
MSSVISNRGSCRGLRFQQHAFARTAIRGCASGCLIWGRVPAERRPSWGRGPRGSSRRGKSASTIDGIGKNRQPKTNQGTSERPLCAANLAVARPKT